MTALTDAEATIETATGARWFRVALRLLPYAAIIGLAIGLLVTRATLERVRLTDRAQLAETQRKDAQANAANAERWGTAADAYAQRTAALKPVILTSHDTVERYAETPAGAAACLAADRVRGIDDLDASLRAAATPERGTGAVRADAGAPAP